MNNPAIIVIAIFVLCTIVFSTFFVVDEMQTAIVLQFGKTVKVITSAGLYAKVPFIQDVIYFDKRILEWDGEANKIPTLDKKFIWVDTTARWKIVDPLKYYQTVRDEYGALKKLDDIIDGITRDVISNTNLIEIVRSTNDPLRYSEETSGVGKEGSIQPIKAIAGGVIMAGYIAREEESISTVESEVPDFASNKNLIELLSTADPNVWLLESHFKKEEEQKQGDQPQKEPQKEEKRQKEEMEQPEMRPIKEGRTVITQKILERSKKDVKDLGIEIIDVMIKRVEYTEDVRQKVYERMVSERKKVAERYRSEGDGQKEMILGNIEFKLKEIRSISYLRAQTIHGAADAIAMELYAQAYQKDPEFYEFYKTLQNYRETIDAKTCFIFSTENEYLKYLKNSYRESPSSEKEAAPSDTGETRSQPPEEVPAKPVQESKEPVSENR